jgi:hypothetical protein
MSGSKVGRLSKAHAMSRLERYQLVRGLLVYSRRQSRRDYSTKKTVWNDS